MKNNKKGIDPRREDTQTQIHNIRILNYCLVICAIGILFFIGGHLRDNEKLIYVGVGMTCGGAMAHAAVMLDEEEEQDGEE